jgi:hypothetical protein
MFVVVSTRVAAQDGGAPPVQVRDVDWQNFTYSSIAAGVRVRTRNGRWESARPLVDRGSCRLDVGHVTYGDLNRDGTEEAVVEIDERNGGTVGFSYAIVYTAGVRFPRRIANIPVGDRADGGIRTLRIVRQRIEVERFGHDTGGSTEPQWVEDEIWSLRGNQLHCDETTHRRRYVSAMWGLGRSHVVRLLPRTSRVSIDGHIFTEHTERWEIPCRARRSWVIHTTVGRERGLTFADGLQVTLTRTDGTALGVVTHTTSDRVTMATTERCVLVVSHPGIGEYSLELSLE